jgi:response regulator RpfG family c-di-GMP phosphodiesterase
MGNTLEILIVDDNRTNLLLLRSILCDEHQIKTFSNPFKVIDHLLNYNADLLISDLMMPEMDGIELLKSVKRIRPELPFFMLTASSDKTNMKEAMKLGADAYLFKPLDIPLLFNKINTIQKKNNHETRKKTKKLP